MSFIKKGAVKAAGAVFVTVMVGFRVLFVNRSTACLSMPLTNSHGSSYAYLQSSVQDQGFPARLLSPLAWLILTSFLVVVSL